MGKGRKGKSREGEALLQPVGRVLVCWSPCDHTRRRINWGLELKVMVVMKLTEPCSYTVNFLRLTKEYASGIGPWDKMLRKQIKTTSSFWSVFENLPFTEETSVLRTEVWVEEQCWNIGTHVPQTSIKSQQPWAVCWPDPWQKGWFI